MANQRTGKSNEVPKVGSAGCAGANATEQAALRGEPALDHPRAAGHQGPPPFAQLRRCWSWTTQRREAFKLVIQGVPMTETAKRVGVHRHTVENWAKTPEWRAEMRAKLEEAQLTTRLRRMQVTSALTDKLGAHSIRALQSEDIDPKRAGLVLREHLDYVRAERELFGTGERRRPESHATTVNITFGAGELAPVALAAKEAALVEFREFMKGYDPKVASIGICPDEAARLLDDTA